MDMHSDSLAGMFGHSNISSTHTHKHTRGYVFYSTSSIILNEYSNTHTHTHIQTHMWICIFTSSLTLTVYPNTHTHTHIHTHTNIHTQMKKEVCLFADLD